MQHDLKTWADKSCRELKPGTPPMSESEVAHSLRVFPGWASVGDAIEKEFRFKDFKGTMKFVNAVAEVAEAQDHHPDLSVSFGSCRVKYSTHSVGGISENDVISAAKIEIISAAGA